MDGKEDNITVIGRIDDKEFHRACLFASALAEEYQAVKYSRTPLFEKDWTAYVTELKKQIKELEPKSQPDAAISKCLPVILWNGRCLQQSIADLKNWAWKHYDFTHESSMITCSRLAKKEYPWFMRSTGLHYAFLAFSIAGGREQQVVVELFHDICPLTCANFEKFCAAKVYSGTAVHKIVREKYIQTGDYRTGKGDFSACFEFYKEGCDKVNQYFVDENYQKRHDEVGVLSMANTGKRDTNGSQFILTLDVLPQLDRKHVVFGRVVSGMRVLKMLSQEKITPQNRPMRQTVCVFSDGPDLFSNLFNVVSNLRTMKAARIDPESSKKHLTKACQRDHAEVINRCLRTGIFPFPHPDSKTGQNLFHISCKTASLAVFNALVESFQAFPVYCITKVVVQDREKDKKIFLPISEHLTVVDAAGRTPLLLACRAGCSKLVSKILCFPCVQVSSHLNHRDRDGFTAFHYSVKFGHTKVVVLLLQQRSRNGLELSLTIANNLKQVPLVSAVRNGCVDIVKILAAQLRSEEIMTRDGNRRNVFHYLAESTTLSQTEMFRVLFGAIRHDAAAWGQFFEKDRLTGKNVFQLAGSDEMKDELNAATFIKYSMLP